MTQGVILLVDPSIQPRSGITSYYRIAEPLLRAQGYLVRYLKRTNKDSLCSFRQRVAAEAESLGSRLVWVEAPETGASTLLIPERVPVHVRLHCPRSLPQIFCGAPIDVQGTIEEARAIQSARVVSAPTEAAWRESRRLHALPRVQIFPNPAPPFVGGLPWAERRGIALIARAQAMKGLQILALLIDKLPDNTRVFFVGHQMPEATAALGLQGRVEALDELDPTGVNRILGSVRVAVIPSLFETFSMVGAEALACDTQVVTWAHSGAAALAPAPLIRSVPPWDLSAFASALREATENEPANGAAAAAVEDLRQRFTHGQNALLQGQGVTRASCCASCSPLPPAALTQLPNWSKATSENTIMVFSEKFPRMRGEAMLLSARKWRKLRHRPVDFFRDMAILRTAKGRLDAWRRRLGAASRHVVTSEQRQGSETQAKSAPRAIASSISVEAGKALPKSSLQRAAELGQNFVDLDLRVVLTDTKSQPRVTLLDEAPRDNLWASLVYIAVNSEPSALEAAAALLQDAISKDLREGFIGFDEKQMFLGKIERMPGLSALDRLNRIDLATKRRLARYRAHIFIDPTDSLPEAIRASVTDSSNVIIVSPTPPEALQLPAPEALDVLVAPACWELPASHRGPLRRILRYGEGLTWPGPAYALRRAIRELGPRPRETLLPIIGGKEPQPDLLDVDLRSTQASLTLEGFDWTLAAQATSFQDFCIKISPHARDLLLAEGLMLRYRDLTGIDTSEMPQTASLLTYSLLDGARYDVHFR